jgi:MFS family permease
MLALGVGVLGRSIPVIAAAFVLTGLGVSVLDVSANVEGAEVERRAERTWMPLMHAAWSIGVAAGAAIGGLCAMIGISPSLQFIGEAVLIAAAALPVVRAIPVGEHAGAEPAPIRSRPRTNWRAVVDRRLVLIGVVMLGVELGEGSANNWLSLAVRDDHRQTATVAAFFFAVFATVEATVRIFAGPVVDRIGRVRAVRYSTAIGVIGVILFIIGGSVWVVLVGVALWAVGVSMGYPLGMSAAATGPYAALRVSAVAAVGFLANLAGPPTIGVLADQHGLLAALWIVVALLAIAFAAAGSLAPPRTASETGDPTEPATRTEP